MERQRLTKLVVLNRDRTGRKVDGLVGLDHRAMGGTRLASLQLGMLL